MSAAYLSVLPININTIVGITLTLKKPNAMAKGSPINGNHVSKADQIPQS